MQLTLLFIEQLSAYIMYHGLGHRKDLWVLFCPVRFSSKVPGQNVWVVRRPGGGKQGEGGWGWW